MRELEEDKELRSTINLYKDEGTVDPNQTVPQTVNFQTVHTGNAFNALQAVEQPTEESPDVALEELLEDMGIEDEMDQEQDDVEMTE